MRLIASIVLSIAVLPAFAQYPTKTVRIIAPFPPGGGVDLVSRAIAERLSPRLGQPVVVDNKPGAGTTIGVSALVTSPPDGYTLMIGPIGSMAIVRATYKNLTFDVRKDLAAVSRIGYGTIAFVVPRSSKANSVKEFVAMAKAEPGKLTFASSGQGALIHLTTEMFKQAAGIDLTHIPYKGTTQILPDMLDARVDLALDSLPAYLVHIKAGKLRALAVASKERSPLMPELPTMAEAGVPGVVSSTDYAMYAPTGTPRDIIVRLNREVNAILQMPDLREKLAAQGTEISGSTPEALAAELEEEIVKWARVVKAAGVVAN